MHKEDLGRYILYTSDDIINEGKEDPYAAELVTELITEDFEKPLEKLQKSGVIVDLSKTRLPILYAHGGATKESTDWVFKDGSNRTPVQEWIDQNDGEYPAILLAVCNPQKREIVSKYSAVIHPRTNLYYYGYQIRGDLIVAFRRPFFKPMRVYRPDVGYIK